MMILLVDGNNLAFVANSLGTMSRKDGFPTQAITNSLKFLHSYIKQFDAEKVFVAWDGGKSKKRLTLLPTYKESRKTESKTPAQNMNFEELLIQMPILKKAIGDLGIYNLFGYGIEGDDLIALMAKKIDLNCKKAVIISSDSDFHQLVSPYISVYSTMARKTGRHVEYSNFSEVHEGLKPEQYLQFKALQGDSSDDIPGVKGIGPTNARKLLLEFGTVENWRSAVESGKTKPSKTLQKIISGWEDYQLSKSMIDLHTPLADFSTAKIQRQEPDFPAVKMMLLEYQIASIFVEFASWIKPFKHLH
jgi:DNA polymerase I